MIWLHRYARLLAAATLILVAAGGMVTSTNSGLSVPDWPTTYGYNMFTYPLSQMAGGIFYEHGHRLIASTVGMLTMGLAAWLWRVEPRAWMRRLGWIALGVVIVQGLLGGLTVLYLLPDAVSISHAGLAQIFFGLTVTLALCTSPGWTRPVTPPVDAPALRIRMVVLTGLVYAQILLGATMRHTGSGLAIPDFPWAFGRLVPPFWNLGIGLHFAHRVGALVVLFLVLANVAAILRTFGHRRDLARPAWLLLGLVGTQVALGAYVVLSGKDPVVNTLHVATGAMVLVTSLFITLRTYRASLDPVPLSMTTHATTHEKPEAETRAHSKVGDVLTLAKLRVNALVVATTAGGYYLAGPQETNLSLLGWTCLGTTLVASGAAAINQVHERDTDRLMNRTRQRPVAAGRMGAGEGLAISGVLSIAGLITLWITSTAAATLVALATFVTYAGVYTPLKRRTSLSTMVGAVPGALPPLIGWAAVRGTVGGIEPWSLFFIGFIWQLPHVLAISWMYREDYARAGIPVLPVIDTHGAVTGRQTVLWAAALIPCSQLPYLFGLTNAAYAVGALMLGVAQLVLAIAFLRHRSVSNARGLFYGSIVYLPALWLLMVAGRQ